MRKLIFVFFTTLILFSCEKETVGTEDFEQAFLKKIELNDLSKNVLIIKTTNSKTFSFEVKDGFESAFNDAYRTVSDEVKHDCEGSGISFAKCVRDAVDAGKCLKVYKVGSTYYADVIAR